MRSWSFFLLLLVLAATAAAQGQPGDRRAELLDPVVEAEPREVLNLRLRLFNAGEVSPWTVDPEVALPSGWSLVVPPGPVTLEPGELLNLVLPIRVAVDARPGSHTFPVRYRTSRGEPAQELLFTVRVASVERVEVTLLDAPAMLAEQEYSATFLVANRGNSIADLRITTRSSGNLPLELRPATLTLEPGEAAEVVVTAAVPADLTARQMHTITLEARPASGGAPAAIARTRTELIPRRIPAASAYHTFPLIARLTGSVGTGAPASTLAGASPSLELSGEGALSAEQSDRLGVRLRVSLAEGLEDALVRYRRDGFGLVIGRQSFSISPLLSDQEGYGVLLDGAWDLGGDLRLGAELSAFDLDDELAFGLVLSAGLGAQSDLDLSLRAAPGDTLVTVGARYAPRVSDTSSMQLSEIDAIYGLRFRADAAPGTAVDLSAKLREGPSAIDLRFTSRSAVFSGASHHSAGYAALGTLRLNGAVGLSQDYPLNLQLRQSTDWRRPVTAADERSGATSVESDFEAALSVAIGRAQLRLAYGSEAVVEDETRELEQELSARVHLAIGEGSSLTQELAWQRETPGSAGRRGRDTIEYSAGLATRTGLSGRLTGEFEVSFDLAEPVVEEISFGASWAGSPLPALDLVVSGEFDPIGGDRLARVTVGGEYSLPNGHSLDLELMANYYRLAPPTLALGIGYAVPLQLPLGRLPGIGEVSGLVTDEAGRPVGGLIATIADQATLVAIDGSFHFPAVPEGSQLLRFIADERSLGPTQLLTPASPLSIEVTAGERSEAHFRVIEGAAVSGTIRQTEPEGEVDDALVGGRAGLTPLVTGVRVELSREDEVVRSITDSTGAFSFRSLRPGEWRLRIFHPNLPGEYRIEPSEQTLQLTAGEVETVAIEIVPLVRRIQFIEGGVLEPGGGD